MNATEAREAVEAAIERAERNAEQVEHWAAKLSRGRRRGSYERVARHWRHEAEQLRRGLAASPLVHQAEEEEAA